MRVPAVEEPRMSVSREYEIEKKEENSRREVNRSNENSDEA